MITATFTDPQGQNWVDAKLRVINFNMNSNSTMSVSHNNLDLPVTNEGSNANANMQIVYWPTQYALDQGHSPYTLENSTDDMNKSHFRFALTVAPATHEALEAACEEYLVNTILPLL
jgi:hypothetical protein